MEFCKFNDDDTMECVTLFGDIHGRKYNYTADLDDVFDDEDLWDAELALEMEDDECCIGSDYTALQNFFTEYCARYLAKYGTDCPFADPVIIPRAS